MTRRKRNILIGVVALLLAVVAFGIPRCVCSHSPDIGEPGPLPVRGVASGDTPQAKAVSQSLSVFGLNLLLREAETGGNVCVSPVSLGSVLSMLHNGALGETGQELAQALGIASLDAATVNQGWADLITAVQTGKKTKVTVFNSLWLLDGIPFEEDFLQVNGDYYAADCMPLKGVEEINSWVSDRTSGEITDLFKKIDWGTYLVAVNTVNLKVGWEFFDPGDTAPRPFKLADGSTVDVDTMFGANTHQSGEPIKVAWTDDYNAFCLKTDGPVDVWVAVPKGDGVPEDIVRALADGNGISDLYEEATRGYEVEIYLPRFEFSYRTDTGLMRNLQAMGIRRLFGETAELQGIADVPPPFYVTTVAQCTHIKVDEKGVEAQAASGAQSGCGAGLPAEIRVERPFLVVLAESSSHAPLFCAIIRDPRSH